MHSESVFIVHGNIINVVGMMKIVGITQISCCLLYFCVFYLQKCVSTEIISDSSIIDRLQQYLRINTAHPNPDYRAAADFIVSLADSLSLPHQIFDFVNGKPIILLKWEGKDPNMPSILLNSHMDVVPAEEHKWIHPPFDAHLDSLGRIYGRGTQDMKSVGMQYLEAIRNLKASGFVPLRTVYLSFVPDEEIGGHDGAEKLSTSHEFGKLNVGIMLDEGLASPSEKYRVFYAERCPWWFVIRAKGAPGHGSKLNDNSAMENLFKSIDSMYKFRTAQFDMVKAGIKAEGEVISLNMVFLKAGTPSPGGFVMNVQPCEAEAGFDIRAPPTANLEALETRIVEEWAPASRNMTFEFKQKASLNEGNPTCVGAESYNPWWWLLEEAVKKANGSVDKPEIFPASTDARYFRRLGIPAIGFSPISNTPILLHDNDEFIWSKGYIIGVRIYESIIRAYASHPSDSTKDEL